MIAGIGIDTVLISRIERIMQQHGDRFLGRIFSRREITEGTKQSFPAPFYAARFAAREAFFKALGTGWGRGFSLREVSVERDKAGKPHLRLSGRIEAVLRSRNIASTHLSLTHDGDYALAVVVLEAV